MIEAALANSSLCFSSDSCSTFALVTRPFSSVLVACCAERGGYVRDVLQLLMDECNEWTEVSGILVADLSRHSGTDTGGLVQKS